MSNRVEIKVRVAGTFELGLNLIDEAGNIYQWRTKNYNSPLFYSVDDEWYIIRATLYTYDYPTPKKGLKYLRIVK